jgi:hypothetical protein
MFRELPTIKTVSTADHTCRHRFSIFGRQARYLYAIGVGQGVRTSSLKVAGRWPEGQTCRQVGCAMSRRILDCSRRSRPKKSNWRK